VSQPPILRQSILLATPCFGGVVSQSYMLSVIRLMSYAKTAGFEVSLSMVSYDALISRARSTLLAAFLDNPSTSHLLFVDADISFEPQQVERLLLFDKDFTGALYPLKSMDWDLIPQRCASAAKACGRLPCPTSELSCPRPSANRKATLPRECMLAAAFN
jgi:hypothetical protein